MGERMGSADWLRLLAGAMSSVWLSATETEVYSAALLIGCLLLWMGERSSESAQSRWLLLAAYVAGLGFALHLTALLTVPAALYLAASRQGPRVLLRNAPAMVVLFMLGASVVLFMLVRAPHDPWVNQGNPSDLSSLTDVLLRKQYMPAPPWPRQAPIFIQIGNLFEYADWQVALGLAPDAPPAIARTTLSIFFGLLGVAGFIQHRRVDRRSWRGMVILFATATLGVLIYLNLKASPSYGGSFIPATARHEARERDYFFSLAFMCWGLWAGFGAVRLLRRLGRKSPSDELFVNAPAMTKVRVSWLPVAGVLAALVPIALNWSAVSRRIEPGSSEARRGAIRVLATAPPAAVILAHADNETYPVWYLQEVERRRRDVTIVVVPLLPATWYRAELARRHALLPEDFVPTWKGARRLLAAICDAAARQNRAVGDAGSVTGDKFPATCDTQ